MSRSIILFAAAALSLGAASAHAQETSMAVSTKGLDLATQAGAQKFYSRLSQAAVAICGGAPTYFMGSEAERFNACHKAAMDAAVAQTHAVLVSALHDKKTAGRTQLASR